MYLNVGVITEPFYWTDEDNAVFPTGIPYTFIAAGSRSTASASFDTIMGLHRGPEAGSHYATLDTTNGGALNLVSRAGGGATNVSDSLASVATEGTWYFWGGGRDTDDAYRMWGNTTPGTGSTNVATPPAVDSLTIGSARAGAQPSDGSFLYFGVYDAYLNDDEMNALGKGMDPRLIRPQNLKSLVMFVGTTPVDLMGQTAWTSAGAGSAAKGNTQLHVHTATGQVLYFPTPAAGGDTTVNALGDDELLIAEKDASIDIAINVAALGDDELLILEKDASIDIAINVAALGDDELVISEKPAAISADRTIAALGDDELVISEKPATIFTGVIVNALGDDELLISEKDASIDIAINVAALGDDALLISEKPASIALGVNVQALGDDELLIAEKPATITIDHTINALAADALVISEQPASIIDTGAVAVLVGTQIPGEPVDSPFDVGYDPSGLDDPYTVEDVSNFTTTTLESTQVVAYADNYVICDRSGFRVLPGDIVLNWDGLYTRVASWDARHPMEFFRPSQKEGEHRKGSVNPEEQMSETSYLTTNEVSKDDL